MIDSASSTFRGPNARRLSAENLVQDFGIRSALTKQCLARLYEVLAREEAAYRRWHRVFSQLWGPAEPRLLRPLGALMRRAGAADEGRPLHFLFALQTHYALLLSLLVKRFEKLRGYEITDPVFAWYLESNCRELGTTISKIAAKLEEYEFRLPPSLGPCGDKPDASEDGWGANDLLRDLHHSLFPRALRHHLGEYYTPDWLAQHVLDQLGFDGRSPAKLLDPACGSGTFLMAAIRRIRQSLYPSPLSPLPSSLSPALPWLAPRPSPLASILRNVIGVDLNPLAVMAARVNYLIAIQDLLPDDKPVDIPVHCGDSILDGSELSQSIPPEVDFIVGNPPWIAWDNLPGDYRDATKPLWERYGLFSLSANAARHGGGKKDLSMLMLYTVADRYLRHGGRLGFVITQTLFQTKGAGDGFRRFRLGQGEPLKVLRVDDLTAIQPFEDAANWTSTIVLEKGEDTKYPVKYVRWKAAPPSGQVENLSYNTTHCTASPIDPNRPTSPWLIQEAGNKVDRCPVVAAPAEYQAHLGANSGGANGVYWVQVLGEANGGVRIRNVAEKSKKAIEPVETIVEPDLLYPLLRWSDTSRYAPLPRLHLLLVQDPERRVGLEEIFLQRQFPLTYAYLRRFHGLLTSRAAYRRYQDGQPFYSMYNVGSYTLADYKVVWRRMDKRLNAAVVEPLEHPLLGRKPVVPQETCVLVACQSADEAHYLCAMLNSDRTGGLVQSHSVRGGKGFGTPSILDYVPIRRYNPLNAVHRELTLCSREAHKVQRGADRRSAENKEPLGNLSYREADRRSVKSKAPLGNLPHDEETIALDEIQRRINRLADEAFRV